MKQRKTLASVSKQISDLVATMGSAPIVYSAPYDNKEPFELVSEKIGDIVTAHKKILGYIRVRKVDDGSTKLGVVVYPNEEIQRKDELQGVDYDRVCF